MKCEYCGQEFERVSTAGRPPKYCSDKCRRDWDKEHKRIQYVGKREAVCRQCGIDLPKNKTRFCSNQCRSRYRAIQDGRCFSHGELEKTCPICGKDFKTWKSKKETCSPECSKKYHLADRRLADRIIDRGITLEKLSARDGDQCQICGLFVDWTDFVKQDNHVTCGRMYPSIDHIKPLSLGGLHSWGNVQLAHMVCNTRKNNRYIG